MLELRFIFTKVQVTKTTLLIAFFGLMIAAIGGAILFAKYKKAGVLAGKILLGLLLAFQINYAITQFVHEGQELRWIIPWNPSSISYWLLPIVAIFNIKFFKDTAYVLGFIAGIVMTLSTILYPSMWLDYGANISNVVPELPGYSMAIQGTNESWCSILMHGSLFVGSVWLVASSDFKIETKNWYKFFAGLLVLVCYAEIGNTFIVPGKNAFFIRENMLPFKILGLHYLFDYLLLLLLLVGAIYGLLPFIVKKITEKKKPECVELEFEEENLY